MLEIISVLLILLGAGFALIGSIGLLRFPDVFTRLHGPTKATTLGVGGVLLGTIVYLALQGEAGVVGELLITVFLFLTAPVSAHLIAKAALHRRCRSVCELPGDEPRQAQHPAQRVNQ
jgi:multicomponent K+:H+ antiporter subunit G